MKKSMIISLVGVLIVTTILLSTGKEKSYAKTLKFNSIDEIVSILDNEIISVYDENYDLKFTNKFLECLSYRKRVTEPMIDFSSFDLKIDESRNTEENKNNIISDYLKKTKNLKNYIKPSKIEAISLTGEAEKVTPRFDGVEKVYVGRSKINLDIVFIDEGEGFVIDYFWLSTFEEGNSNDSY